MSNYRQIRTSGKAVWEGYACSIPDFCEHTFKPLATFSWPGHGRIQVTVDENNDMVLGLQDVCNGVRRPTCLLLTAIPLEIVPFLKRIAEGATPIDKSCFRRKIKE